MLGVKQFGQLALVAALVGTVNQVIDSRVWETAIRFVIHYREQQDHARATAVIKLCYLIDALTGVVAFLIIFLTADLAAHLFIKDVSAGALIKTYAVVVLITIPEGTPSALLRISNSFNKLAYQNVGLGVVRFVGVLIVALFGWGIYGVIFVTLFSSALGVSLLLVISRTEGRKLGLTKWSQAPLNLLRGQYRRILRFTFYSNMVGTTRLITSRADLLILGGLATPSEVGVYKLARMLSDRLSFLFSPIHNALYPELSKLVGQKDFKRIASLQTKLSGTIAAVVIPTCLLLTVGALLIPLAFGKEFTGAVVLTQIMVWSIIWTPLIWLPGLLLSLERSGLLAGWNGLDAGSYIVLLLVLVPRFGALGAAIATLIRFILWVLTAAGVLFYLRNGSQLRRKTI